LDGIDLDAIEAEALAEAGEAARAATDSRECVDSAGGGAVMPAEVSVTCSAGVERRANTMRRQNASVFAGGHAGDSIVIADSEDDMDQVTPAASCFNSDATPNNLGEAAGVEADGHRSADQTTVKKRRSANLEVVGENGGMREEALAERPNASLAHFIYEL
jgi:hypothetical protein